MPMEHMNVSFNEDKIEFRIGDGTVVYTTDVNAFEENSGLTIKNVDFNANLEGYYLNLGVLSNSFVCGNIIDNLAMEIKSEYENVLLIVDFEGVEELSNSFFVSYTKFLLQSSNKIITINMNTALTNEFSNFIKTNIKESEE